MSFVRDAYCVDFWEESFSSLVVVWVLLHWNLVWMLNCLGRGRSSRLPALKRVFVQVDAKWDKVDRVL